MPALLLAYGDPEAKDMLRKAIDARYGTQPPALEYLQLKFSGRTHVKFGPVKTWVPVEAAAYLKFPQAMRWDFTVKPLGLPVQRGVEAYNGEVYRSTRGKKVTAYTDENMVNQFRRRLWAIAAILLTPLSEGYVKLAKVSDRAFSATNTQLDDTVIVSLRDDYTVASVQVECINPDTQTLQMFKIEVSQILKETNMLFLPDQLSAYWNDVIYYELHPIDADFQVRIPTEVFRTDTTVGA